MNKRQSNIDKYTKRWIQNLRNEGKTIMQIAKIVGYSKSAVQKHL